MEDNLENTAVIGKTSLTTKLMLAALVLAGVVAAYNENLVNVALPQIMAEFSIDAVTAQWLVSGYMVITACFAITSALLINRFRERKVFYCVGCLIIFGLVLDMVAPTFEVVLVGRLIQAAGTGLSIPMMMSSLFLLAPEGKQGLYMAIGPSITTIGPALAPVISGFIVVNFGWRVTICVPAALMLTAMQVGLKGVHDLGEPQHAPIDVLSILISLLGLFCLSYGLSVITSDTLRGIIFLLAFLLMALVFCRRQLRLETPLLSLEPVKNKRYTPSIFLMFVGMLCAFSLSVMLPLYYQQASGLSADAAGLLLLGPIVINAIATLCSGMIYDRVGPWPILPLSLLFMCVGLLGTSLLMNTGEVVPVMAVSMLEFIGVGVLMSVANVTGLSAVEERDVTTATSIIQLFVMIAASAGPALFTGIMTTVANAQMAQGAAQMAANAAGYASAIMVAFAISVVGLIVATIYAWNRRK